MGSVKELEKLIKSTKDLKERKKELEKQKEVRKPIEHASKKTEEEKEIKENKIKEEIKNKMQKLREEVSEIKGRDLEKEDIKDLIIEEKEPEHLWNKKKAQPVKTEATEDKKVAFREGHWHKTEQQKKENKMSSLNIDIQEKPLHPEEVPEETKQILEKLKETASQYKGIKKIEKPIQEEKLFEKGVSEEVIAEKKNAEKVLPEKKPKLSSSEEEQILRGFILDKPDKKRLEKEPRKKETEKKPEKKGGSGFQTIFTPAKL